MILLLLQCNTHTHIYICIDACVRIYVYTNIYNIYKHVYINIHICVYGKVCQSRMGKCNDEMLGQKLRKIIGLIKTCKNF